MSNSAVDSFLRSLKPQDYNARIMTSGQIFGWFEICDAVWLHDGNPQNPHAELTSGLCSNGFFDCGRVLCYPNLTEILAHQLAKKLRKECPDRIDWVIGSPYAAITFSYEVARALNVTHGFVEKDLEDFSGKTMLWRRMTIPAGAKILQIEELITTLGTAKEVRRAIEDGNSEPVEFLPLVGTLIHRPPRLPVNYGQIKVVSLFEKEVWAIAPDDCPLCKVGSPRYRPKTHWRELTGKL